VPELVEQIERPRPDLPPVEFGPVELPPVVMPPMTGLPTPEELVAGLREDLDRDLDLE